MILHHYFYLPVAKHLSKQEQIDFVLNILDASIAEKQYMGMYDGFIPNVKMVFNNRKAQHFYLSLTIDTTFASDPRSFVRVRMDQGRSVDVGELLVEKAKELRGFYGSSSKEFFNADGLTIWNVKDGTTTVSVSPGEVTELIHRSIKDDVEIVIDSRQQYVDAIKKHLGIELKIADHNQYLMPIVEQVTSSSIQTLKELVLSHDWETLLSVLNEHYEGFSEIGVLLEPYEYSHGVEFFYDSDNGYTMMENKVDDRMKLIFELTNAINKQQKSALSCKHVDKWVGTDTPEYQVKTMINGVETLADPITAEEVMELWA